MAQAWKRFLADRESAAEYFKGDNAAGCEMNRDGYRIRVFFDRGNVRNNFGLWAAYVDGDTEEGCKKEMSNLLADLTAVTFGSTTYADLQNLRIVG